VIFNLVSWAEQTGRIDELVQGAYRKNMGNPAMQQFLHTWREAAPRTAGHVPATLPVMSNPVSIDVFLSYTRKDAEAMRRVQEGLRAAGLSVWTDEGLEAGTKSWRAAIEEAVKQAPVMVVLLSPDAKASQWVENETGYAQTLKKPVLPILIAGDTDISIPISLINVQWVDGRKDLQRAVERDLLPVLHHRLHRAEPAAPAPDTDGGNDSAAAAASTVDTVPAPSSFRQQERPTNRRQLLIFVLIVVLPLLVGILGLYLAERMPFLAGTSSNNSLDGSSAVNPTSATGEISVTETIPSEPTVTATAPPMDEPIATRAPELPNTPAAALTISSITTLINPVDGAVYVYVPAGRFIMGSDDATQEASDDEKPQQSDQYLDAFWIMRTEVTIAQYARCVQAGACFEHHFDPTRPEHPAMVVTWREASDYAAWAGGRLPTEAEWEKACRGSEGLLYPWGSDALTTERANFGRNVASNTTAVGSYPTGASPFGLLDMAGNVAEWTSSQYQPYPYSASDGREDAAGDSNRTVRGGGWASFRGDLHCAARAGVAPDDSSTGIGFRVVMR
jgi:formylglycine-generating enzyme required for sulfatase activity